MDLMKTRMGWLLTVAFRQTLEQGCVSDVFTVSGILHVFELEKCI